MSDIYRDSIFWVEVERIKPNPFQPRRDFDQAKLAELSESIRMYGLLQPLTVTRKETPLENGGISVEYELVAGERRLRASKMASIQQVPVIIRTGEDDDQVKLELAIIENLQREDLNPVDRAYAFQKLYKDFGFTHVQIGKKMGKSREYVSNTLRLLSLPEEMLQHLSQGRISEGHTRPLLMLNDKPQEQAVLMKEILLKKLTVRESESIARRVAQDKVTARHKIDPDILSVERVLTERLGTRVTIEPREVGGRLVISFFSANDLQALLDSMRVDDESAVIGGVFDGTEQEQSVQSTAQTTATPETVVVMEEASEEMEDSAPSPEVVVQDVMDTFEAMSTPAVEPFVQATQARQEVASFEVDTVQVENAPVDILSTENVVEKDGSFETPILDTQRMTEQAPVAIEKPRESIMDSFVRTFTGGSEKAEQVPTQKTPMQQSEQVPAESPAVTGVAPAPSVAPSETRPMPEPAPIVAQAPEVEEKKEDDSELYSIRNFSI